VQLRPDAQLKTMIKAMTDVIIPALDGSNQLAMEQSRLVVGMMILMERQLPLQFRFDRDELARLIETAHDLVALAGAEREGGLERARCTAAAVLDRCQAGPDDLHLAVRDMRVAICDTIDRMNDPGAHADATLIAACDAIVLRMSQQQLLRDRVLLLPQGWELQPDALPDIETLIADRKADIGNDASGVYREAP